MSRIEPKAVRGLLFLAAVCAPVAIAHTGRADSAPVCKANPELDKLAVLRRLSLDLRGRPPTVEEYEALEKTGSIGDATIDGYLATPDFGGRMRRYHEDMFWPNVSNVRISGVIDALTKTAAEPALHYATTGRAKLYRGDAAAVCGDYEQKDFDPAFPNEFRPINVTPDAQGVKREGWRMVRPYWAPDTTVKVCAYDAQEGLTGASGKVTVACNTPEAGPAATCGCGPNLRHCFGGGSAALILQSMREQLARSVDDVTTGGRPYTDILLSTKAWVDGRLAFWKKYFGSYGQGTYNIPDPAEEIPTKDFTDTTWVQVDRKGLHAGVITLPAYLLRFQTDRGRANRFRIDFMGEYFVPPAKLDPAPGCSTTSSDLTERCNCQYCHQKLEPLASHFGQFAEAGTTLMTDLARFPRTKADCVSAKPSAFCSRFYVTNAEAHRPGSLLTYQFTDTHPDFVPALEGGPRKLAQQIIQDGTFSRTVVRRMFLQLAKRDLRVEGEKTDELDLLDRLSKGFEAAGFNLKWLVREIVKLPAYRRVP